ncbi:MAG: hypothetical protein ACXAEU_23805 [Candidatus Hodarchaeales archaeon]|jgi:hypothetical protein
MAGTVTNYESKKRADKVKSLQGVKKVPLVVAQYADQRGDVGVILGVEVERGDIRVFPADTWGKLGKIHTWLQELIDEELYATKPVRMKSTKKKAAKQVKQAVAEVSSEVNPL